jgi:hypothetical protein
LFPTAEQKCPPASYLRTSTPSHTPHRPPSPRGLSNCREWNRRPAAYLPTSTPSPTQHSRRTNVTRIAPADLSHLCAIHLRPVSQRDTVSQPRAPLWVPHRPSPAFCRNAAYPCIPRPKRSVQLRSHLSPALRPGQWIFQRPSPQKQNPRQPRLCRRLEKKGCK